MVDLQRFTGDAAAKNNDYSILGKLFGLTQDQVDRLQGTGIYAPKPDDGGEYIDPREIWGKNYRGGSSSSGGGSGGSSGGGSGGSSGSGGGSKNTGGGGSKPAIQDGNPDVLRYIQGKR